VVLSQLYPRLPERGEQRKLAIVACVDVRFLGANVPTKDLVAMMDARAPDLVGLSGTMSFHVPALVSTIDALRGLRGADFPILIGGSVLSFAPHLEGSSESIVTGADADQRVDRCRARLGC
jgi:cobalamin-dependent methionine synthase I